MLKKHSMCIWLVRPKIKLTACQLFCITKQAFKKVLAETNTYTKKRGTHKTHLPMPLFALSILVFFRVVFCFFQEVIIFLREMELAKNASLKITYDCKKHFFLVEHLLRALFQATYEISAQTNV